MSFFLDCDQSTEPEVPDPILSTEVTQVPSNSTVVDISAQEDAEVTPNQEETPELDSELLEILGIDPSNTEKFGKEIQKDVAIRFEHLATNGLSKDDRKHLTDKYLVPANCKLISPPTLNPEVKAALSETIIKRDKVIASKQALISTAISSIGEAITHILASKEKQPELLRILMDTGRALCDCQHNDTITRRNFVVFSVKKDMKESLLNAKVDNFLFGQNLPETLKSAKAINKSGAELKVATVPKPSTSKQNSSGSGSKNWKGSYPPRKQPAKTYTTTTSATMKNQRANSSKQSQNQRPARTTTAPHSRR